MHVLTRHNLNSANQHEVMWTHQCVCVHKHTLGVVCESPAVQLGESDTQIRSLHHGQVCRVPAVQHIHQHDFIEDLLKHCPKDIHKHLVLSSESLQHEHNTGRMKHVVPWLIRHMWPNEHHQLFWSLVVPKRLSKHHSSSCIAIVCGQSDKCLFCSRDED